MGLSDLKSELKKLEKVKIIDLVADLYKKNKSVKEFFDFYLNPKEDELFNKYRDKVVEAFYPKRGFNLKLKEGKQAISDFKKLEPSALLLVDLMLLYVETGVKFTNEFGDIDEGFYSSIEKTYAATLSLMQKEHLLEPFADRAAKVVSDTSGIGWGFHDYLGEIHSQFYPDYSFIPDEISKQKGIVLKIGRKKYKI
jgi:hypothetical protein